MSTTLTESESLRFKLQQIAHAQRARTIERRLHDGLRRRVREWNDTVHCYMDAVRRLAQLHELAVRAVRSEHLIRCLKGANVEIVRVRSRFLLVGEMLCDLSGININAESIETVYTHNSFRVHTSIFKYKINPTILQVRNNTNRISQLTATLTEIAQNSNHINQGEKVREFQQKISGLANENLKASESNAKYISRKTINVSSDLMMAKLVAEVAHPADQLREDQ